VDIAGTGGRMEDVLPASNDRIDRWRIGIGENIIALD
jgi:hypothetical protein